MRIHSLRVVTLCGVKSEIARMFVEGKRAAGVERIVWVEVRFERFEQFELFASDRTFEIRCK